MVAEDHDSFLINSLRLNGDKPIIVDYYFKLSLHLECPIKTLVQNVSHRRVICNELSHEFAGSPAKIFTVPYITNGVNHGARNVDAYTMKVKQCHGIEGYCSLSVPQFAYIRSNAHYPI